MCIRDRYDEHPYAVAIFSDYDGFNSDHVSYMQKLLRLVDELHAAYYDGIGCCLLYTSRHTAVYSACADNVVLTMIDGSILYENGEFTTIDEEKLKYDMRNECGGYFKNKKQ